jgi:hypothetical protein
MSTSELDWTALRAEAAAAARRSYSPYSRFPVGAAAVLADGATISATNVENASYVAGICAETALVGVLVAGGREGTVPVRSVPPAAARDGWPGAPGERAVHGRLAARRVHARRPDVRPT